MKFRKTSKIITLLMLVCLLMPFSEVLANQRAVSNEAEQHILNELNRANIPNAAIAVIQNGETSYILHNSELNTLFGIGSVTKSLTAFGVLLLEDMGLLSLSDPVNLHLPWFNVRHNGQPVPHEDIRIYNLLQHTSGFTSNERRFTSTFVELSEAEFIAVLDGIELAFYPSADHIYGNVNYVILGLLLEAVSGQSYDDFMTQNVLHPLGLYNTFTNTQRAKDTGRVVDGHRFGFLRPRVTNELFPPLVMPTGGAFSSISDMARWTGIQAGFVDVSDQFARIVQRSHENFHGEQNPFTDRDFHYAAGWGVRHQNGEIHHGGNTPGYSSQISFLQQDNTAVVVLANLGSSVMTSPFVTLVLDAVVDDNFNAIGTDPFAIMDMVFVVLTAVGVLFVGLFVWRIMKLNKQLPNGWREKPTLRIKWIFAPILSIIGLFVFYVGMPMAFQIPFRTMMVNGPASGLAAIIVMWVMAVYSLFSLWTKVFVSPKVGK